MSGYSASCPACGAPVVFGLGASLLRVCDHCGVAVARKGASVENYGKVAELIPTPSVLALGLEGDYEGAPPFRLAGRLQLDHGSGTWDEWVMAFEDGSYAWLSEAQGKFHYMGLVALPPVPRFQDLKAGRTLDLGPPGVFVVTEVREGRFASAQGELPFEARPGAVLRYADLSGPGGQFATLDYGSGDRAEALYVGREVSLAELHFEDLPDEAARRKRAAGKSLSCPQCGGPLALRAPDHTERFGCPWCGSLLDAQRDFAILEKLESQRVKPDIPLGSRGTLAGVEWTVIGFMERSTVVEGIRYPWREYLLYEPPKGFRWLAEAKGHWTFVEPVHAGDVQLGGSGRGASHAGRRFKHFQTSNARVDTVIGEFYWSVARGDRTTMDDFVAPPLMLSREADGKEVVWSQGRYLEPAELWRAFGLRSAPPYRKGVGPNQPWGPKPHAGGIYGAGLMFAALAFFVYMLLLIGGARRIHDATVGIPAGVAPGAPEAARFVGPFEMTRRGNLQVKVQAPVDNSWIYLDGALINEASGEFTEFDLEVSYYHGRDSDGSWTEGSTSATAYVPAVAPGVYVLRLAPQWGPGRPPSGYKVTLRSGVPRFTHLVVAWGAILAWPALLGWRHFRFEAERWSESDHPWVESE